MMNFIKSTILRIGIFCLNLLYAFIKLCPIRKKITFISRQTDEIPIDFKLIGDMLYNKDEQWQVVYLTKRIPPGVLGAVAYCFHILRQMYHIATSRVVVLDGYCIAISVLKHKKQLLVIQIWHAIGCMKKFGYAMIGEEEGSSARMAQIMKMHRNYDWALISSYSFINDYLEGFHIPREKILQIPLPKVDLLTNNEYIDSQRKKLLEEYPILKDKKNILYCPTFRKHKEREHVGLDKLAEQIDFKEYNLIYKPHPNITFNANNSNIIEMPYKTMEILPVADYVISDYSSVIYEAGLLRKPVFLYAYDWDEYSKTRKFNLDLEKDVPTLFSKDPGQIVEAIEKDDFNYEKFDDFIKKNVVIPQGGCTKAIVGLILDGKEKNHERYNERNFRG